MGMARGGRGATLGVQRTIQKQAPAAGTKVTLKKVVANKVTELNQTGQLSQEIRLGAVAKSLAQLDEETALSVLDLESLTGIEDPNRFLQDAVQAILEDDEEGEEVGNGAEVEQAPAPAPAHGKSGKGKGRSGGPGFFQKRAQEAAPAAKAPGFFRERAKDGKGGKKGKAGKDKGKSAAQHSVFRRLNWINSNVKLQKPLDVDRCVKALTPLTHSVAMRLLINLQAQFEKIQDPNGWICKSAQKHAQENATKGQFAPARLATPQLAPVFQDAPPTAVAVFQHGRARGAPKGRGRASGAKGGVKGAVRQDVPLTASQAKVSRFVKWIDKNCALRQPLIYSNVKAALDLVDETGQMRILTMLKEKAAELPNPQGWVWARCKRNAEQFNKKMQDRSRVKAEARARAAGAPRAATGSSAALAAEEGAEAEEEDGFEGLEVGEEEGDAEMVEEVAEFAEGAEEEEAANFAEGAEEEAEWAEGAEEEAAEEGAGEEEGGAAVPLDEGEA